ncbi:hypothetical protein KJ671_00835 [Patescibacteria group bacterium]|nr:hypothetical protein [Patescibacteria group bacterium]
MKIILLTAIFFSALGFVGTVDASDSSVYVSPANLTTTVGSNISASIGVNTSGNKVCAVEGKLVFNNLSCQSITIAEGVTPQTSPTCSNPNFLVGIPNCTSLNKVLFTVSAKAGSSGVASISITGVDVIGEGFSVGSGSGSGNYTINALPVVTTPTPTPTPAKTKTVKTEKTIVDESESGNDENKETSKEDKKDNKKDNLAAVSGATEGSTTPSTGFKILIGFIVLIAIFYAGYLFTQKKKKNKFN